MSLIPAKPSVFTLAQISDCHLFAQKDGEHYGANVYRNLVAVLADIKNQHPVQAIIFTGDITQDHSDASYQLFVQAVVESGLEVPFYYLAGNHDEHVLLDKYLSVPPFKKDKWLHEKHWQIALLNSKSDTPKGLVTLSELSALAKNIDKNKYQLVMMHHHPIDVGYFIDRHGLENQQQFWQTIQQQPSIRAIACGHIHQAMTVLSENSDQPVPLFTCPATSIQFDTTKDSGSSNGQGAGYRLFSLDADGQISTDSYFLSSQVFTKAAFTKVVK